MPGKIMLPIALVAATVATTQAAARAADPADVIEYRQAVFQVTKNNFGPIADMLKGEIDYDQATVEKNAAVVQMMSTLVGDLFPEGTDATPDETDALMDIWDEPDAFADAVAEFEETSVALARASESGDKRQLAAAVKDVGASCKACHDDFRRDD
ncbi:MAG: c-type cytochrome [Guyparkeria sp.]|uniref:c-type cytochrome n=1 Tax=Guyparkeria sp. TaxID=2035736 RepID=UPI00397E7ECE